MPAPESIIVATRLEPEHHEKLERVAKADSRTIGAYLRLLILRDIGVLPKAKPRTK